MSTSDTPEIAAEFGVLDSAGPNVADGGALDAHTLRTMAIQANRLTAQGHPLANMVWRENYNGNWDKSGWVYTFTSIAFPQWSPILPPIPVRKKPGLTRGMAKVRAVIPFRAPSAGASTVHIKFETLGHPFSNSTSDESVISMTSNAATTGTLYGDASTEGVFDLLPTDEDLITIWMKADVNGDTGDTSAHGVPYTGTITGATANAITVVPASLTWKDFTGTSWAMAGHYVEFDSTVREGTPVVTGYSDDGGTFGVLYLAPELKNPGALVGKTFTIRKLPTVAIQSISIYAQDRTG